MNGRGARRLVVMVVLALVVLGSACGAASTGAATSVASCSSTHGGSTGSGLVVVAVGRELCGSLASRTVAVLETRFHRLGLSVTIRASGGRLIVTTASDRATLVRALTTVGLVQLRPVLEVLPSRGGPVTPPLDDIDTRTVVMASAGTHRATYRVGPSVLDNSGFKDARPTNQSIDGEWTIDVVLRSGDAGIATLNRLARHCMDADRTCPAAAGSSSGRMAFSLDGVVMSAPVMEWDSFAANQVQLTAPSRVAAQILAAALISGPLPVPLAVR